MLKHTALAVVVGLAVLAPAVYAQGKNPAVGGARSSGPHQTLRHFQQRIQGGVRRGAITPQELQQLRQEMTALRDKIRAARQSGGSISPAERRQLRQEMRRISREIFRAAHNGRKIKKSSGA